MLGDWLVRRPKPEVSQVPKTKTLINGTLAAAATAGALAFGSIGTAAAAQFADLDVTLERSHLERVLEAAQLRNDYQGAYEKACQKFAGTLEMEAGLGTMLHLAEHGALVLQQGLDVHLLGPGVHLDRRNPGVAGAARAPQAMLQEYLNRSEAHLWAILSNGSTLRLLRDSTALAGSAYLEFDLDTIFDGELYSEFKDLYTIAHSSRLGKRGGPGAGASRYRHSLRRQPVLAPQ